MTDAQGKERVLGRSRSGTALRLFLTCWMVYALHFATNIERELYLALALGDGFSIDVSEYYGLHDDLFELEGSGTFINNNPGASMMGAIPYALARPFIHLLVSKSKESADSGAGPEPTFDDPNPEHVEFFRKARVQGLTVKLGLAAGVTQFLLMAPLSALSIVVLFFLLAARTKSDRKALALAIVCAVATPVFFRTAQLNHNLLVSHCAFFAFVLLWYPFEKQRMQRSVRFVLAGLCCGWALVLDYSGLVVIVALGTYAISRVLLSSDRSRAVRDVGLFVAGILVSTSVLWGYQWAAFGHPFLPAQHFMPDGLGSDQGYRGMGWPGWRRLWDTGFHPGYGLFVSAPLLGLAFVPAGWAKSSVFGKLERWFVGLFIVLFFLFCASNHYAFWQVKTGVRHIVPVTPFLFLAAAGVLLQLPFRIATPVVIATSYWSWCLAMYRDVEFGRGVFEAFYRITFGGGVRLPWMTTLEQMGYLETASALPLLIMTGALLWMLWRK